MIDRDEHFIWVPVAEYRPNSRSIMYRVSLKDFTVNEVFRFPDHIGAIIRDVERNRLIGFSWGGRRIYNWQLVEQWTLKDGEDPIHRSHTLTPQHYIDYQDCQYVGSGMAICPGLASYSMPEGREFSLGGIELIEVVLVLGQHNSMSMTRPDFERPAIARPDRRLRSCPGWRPASRRAGMPIEPENQLWRWRFTGSDRLVVCLQQFDPIKQGPRLRNQHRISRQQMNLVWA